MSSLDADLATQRRALIAARDFLNRLPINDGASKRAIDREFIGLTLIPEGLLAADRVEAEITRLREAEEREQMALIAVAKRQEQLEAAERDAEEWRLKFVSEHDDRLAAENETEAAEREVARRLALVEVARAAREACDVAPALMSDGPFAQKLNDLFAALARLDGKD